MARVKEAYSYDDILLVPRKSSVLPRNTDMSTALSETLGLNSPIISAAMDRVTETDMAVAMARSGGMGIIHKNMLTKSQAKMIRRVKRSESGLIIDPVTLHPSDDLDTARELMARKGVSGFPVVNRNDKLVGILTNRDMRTVDGDSGVVKDAMTANNLVTARKGVSIEAAQKLMHKHRIEKLPVVDDQGALKGLITLKDIANIQKYPNSSKDDRGRLVVGAAVGVGEDGFNRAKALVEAGADALIVDSAHGHSEGILDAAEKIKYNFRNVTLIVGNVATPEAAEECIKHGADVIKVGIGPGSICTTRVVAGVGVPQFTAVLETAKMAWKYDVPVIADGGIKTSGDIVKALAAGASAVMLGNLLAGTDEAPGESVLVGGRRYKEYRGMGSKEAMQEGSADRYFQDNNSSKLTPEGVSGLLPYKGPVIDTLDQLKGGIQAGLGYMGAKTLAQLRKRPNFRLQTAAGFRESHVHDLDTVYESPNYQAPKKKF